MRICPLFPRCIQSPGHMIGPSSSQGTTLDQPDLKAHTFGNGVTKVDRPEVEGGRRGRGRSFEGGERSQQLRTLLTVTLSTVTDPFDGHIMRAPGKLPHGTPVTRASCGRFLRMVGVPQTVTNWYRLLPIITFLGT